MSPMIMATTRKFRIAAMPMMALFVVGCGTSVNLDLLYDRTDAFKDCLAPSSLGRCDPGPASDIKTTALPPTTTQPLLRAKELSLDKPFADEPSAQEKSMDKNLMAKDRIWLSDAKRVLQSTRIAKLDTGTQASKGISSVPGLGEEDGAKIVAKAAIDLAETNEAKSFFKPLAAAYRDARAFRLAGTEIVEATLRIRELDVGDVLLAKDVAGRGFAVLKDDLVDGFDDLAAKLSKGDNDPIEVPINARGILAMLGEAKAVFAQPDGWRLTLAALRMQQYQALKDGMDNKSPGEMKRLAESYDMQARRITLIEAYFRAYLRGGNVIKFQLDKDDVTSVENFIKLIDDKMGGFGDLTGLQEHYLAKLRKFLAKKYSEQTQQIDDFIKDWMDPDKVWSEFLEEVKGDLRNRLAKWPDGRKLTAKDKEALLAGLEKLVDRLLPSIKPWFDSAVAGRFRELCTDKGDIDTPDKVLASCLPALDLKPQIPDEIKTILSNLQEDWTKKRDAVKGWLVKLEKGIVINAGGSEETGFTTRYGTKLQSPVANIVGSLKNSSIKLTNKDEIKKIPSGLVRVLVEAVFDSLQPLPAVSDATGVQDNLLHPLPKFTEMAGKDGYKNVSLETFRKVTDNSAMVEGFTSLGTSVAIRGFNVFSIDNEVIEEMLETLVAAIARKSSEKIFWCAYACKTPETSTPKATTPASSIFSHMKPAARRKVTLNIKYSPF